MSPYSEIVTSHFQEPRNAGEIEAPDACGHAGGRRAGPFMRFTARLRGGVLEEVRFQTYGCVPAIAAGSFLSEVLWGKTFQETESWNVPRLVEALGGLPEDKTHCAELAISALRDLCQNCRERGFSKEASSGDGSG